MEEPSGEDPVESEIEEPWRVFPDVDIIIPGDRLDQDGNVTDGPGIFRYHSDCHNDFGWGGSYRNVQTILCAILNPASYTADRLAPIIAVPKLPELTEAMGAGKHWLPKDPSTGNKSSKRLSVEDRMKLEAETMQDKPEKIADVVPVKPHDIADYLEANFNSVCGPMKLVMYQTREGVTLAERRTSILGKASVYEIWQRTSGTYEIGSPEVAAESRRWREFLAGHLHRTQKPLLIDDGVGAYVVAGYRELNPEEEPHPVQYRILDPQYGLRYSERKYNAKFKPEDGKDQYGKDERKDQWVPAEWVEEGRGICNRQIAGPMWMVLLIG